MWTFLNSGSMKLVDTETWTLVHLSIYCQNKEFQKFFAFWAAVAVRSTVLKCKQQAQSAGKFKDSLFWRYNDEKFYGQSDFK